MATKQLPKVAYIYSLMRGNVLVGTVEFRDGELIYTGDVTLVETLANAYLLKGFAKEMIPVVLVNRNATYHWASHERLG